MREGAGVVAELVLRGWDGICTRAIRERGRETYIKPKDSALRRAIWISWGLQR